MVNLDVTIKNPYPLPFEGDYGWGKAWRLSENKSAEAQVLFVKSVYELVGLSLSVTTREDHAGVRFHFGILGLEVDLNLYDNRHWDHEAGTWHDGSE